MLRSHFKIANLLIVLFAGFHMVLSQELLGHWNFDESTGDTIRDVSGNSNHGTLKGNVQRTPGVSGNALKCDGIDDYALIDHGLSLTGMSELTIEVWIRLAKKISVQHMNVLNIWGPESSGDDAYGIGFPNGNHQWCLSLSGDSVNDVNNPSSDSIAHPGLWYHLTAVYTGDSVILYTNGHRTFVDKSMGQPIQQINRALMIGWFDYEPNSYFDGDIDEVKIYSYALSSDTIKAHFDALNPQNVIAHWDFNEGTGDTAYDKSGNNAHLTLYNGAKWAKTHHGYGVDLDGLDDVCRAPDKPNQNGLRALTAEAVFLIKQYNIYDQYTVIVDKWGPGSSEDDAWACDLYNNGVNGLYGNVVGRNRVQRLYSYNKLPRNKWFHLAFVWTGDSLHFYVNGKLDTSCQETGIDIIKTTNSEIRVGNGAEENNGLYGVIDDITLYNYPIPPDSIKAHFERFIKPAHEINIGIKKHHAKPGDELWVPIYLANFEDTISISSIQFSLKFDTSLVTFIELSKDSGIAANWSISHNPNFKDSIIFSMGGAGQTIEYGEGELFRCKFKVNPSATGNRFTDLAILDVQIDEGMNVHPTTTDGKITIEEITIMYGDISGNNEVTAYDAAGIIQYVLGLIQIPNPNYPNFSMQVADVSGDKTITSYDAALIFLYSIGLLYKFPVETGFKKRNPLFPPELSGFPESRLKLNYLGSNANIAKFDLIGSGVTGANSFDIILKYNPAKILIEQGGNITTSEYLNLESSLDKTVKNIKISITTADDIDEVGDLKLATIEAPVPDTSVLKEALLFVKALVNEENVKYLDPNVSTNLNSSKVINFCNPIRLRNNVLEIDNKGKNPVFITLYDLHGRCVLKHSCNQNNSRITIQLKDLASGLFVSKIQIGSRAYTRALLVGK